MPADREHFIDSAIADHFPHDAFGKIAQSLLRFARTEEIHPGIGDPILHDPRDEGRVQIAGNHRFGICRFRIALILVGRVGRRETEFKFYAVAASGRP